MPVYPSPASTLLARPLPTPLPTPCPLTPAHVWPPAQAPDEEYIPLNELVATGQGEPPFVKANRIRNEYEASAESAGGSGGGADAATEDAHARAQAEVEARAQAEAAAAREVEAHARQQAEMHAARQAEEEMHRRMIEAARHQAEEEARRVAEEERRRIMEETRMLAEEEGTLAALSLPMLCRAACRCFAALAQGCLPLWLPRGCPRTHTHLFSPPAILTTPPPLSLSLQRAATARSSK